MLRWVQLNSQTDTEIYIHMRKRTLTPTHAYTLKHIHTYRRTHAAVHIAKHSKA